MTSDFDTHGRLKCVTITTPLFVRSLNDYRRIFGFIDIESGLLADDLAGAWAAPDSAGKRYALLQPKNGNDCFIRLVEGTHVADYAALRSFGWASMSLAVQDLAALHENIEADGAYTILSGPSVDAEHNRKLSVSICGQANEILTLIETKETSVPNLQIATLATPDNKSALDHYISAFQLKADSTQTEIRAITNNAFGLPENMAMLVSRTKISDSQEIEFEQYPSGASIRPMHNSELTPGISILTIAVRNLDEVEEDFLSEPCVRHGPLYASRRTATVMGPADELVELIEIG
jgi:hypothetical protein